MKFDFRKLYQRIDEGAYFWALVGYAVRPERFEHFAGKTYCVEQNHRLGIDLWIGVLKFEWNTKIFLPQHKDETK